MFRNKPQKLWGFYHGTSVGPGSLHRPLASSLNKPLVMGVGRGKRFGEKADNSDGLSNMDNGAKDRSRFIHQRWKLHNSFFL